MPLVTVYTSLELRVLIDRWSGVVVGSGFIFVLVFSCLLASEGEEAAEASSCLQIVGVEVVGGDGEHA